MSDVKFKSKSGSKLKFKVKSAHELHSKHAIEDGSSSKSISYSKHGSDPQNEDSVGLEPGTELPVSAPGYFRRLVEPYLSPLVSQTICACDESAINGSAKNGRSSASHGHHEHVERVLSSLLKSSEYCRLKDGLFSAVQQAAASVGVRNGGLEESNSFHVFAGGVSVEDSAGDVCSRTVCAIGDEAVLAESSHDTADSGEPLWLSDCAALYSDDCNDRSDSSGSDTLCPSSHCSHSGDVTPDKLGRYLDSTSASIDSMVDRWDISVDVPDADHLHAVIPRLVAGCEGGSGSCRGWDAVDVCQTGFCRDKDAVDVCQTGFCRDKGASDVCGTGRDAADVCECLETLVRAVCADAISVDMWLVLRLALRRYLTHQTSSVAELALKVHWCLLTQEDANSQYFICQAYLNILETLALIFTNHVLVEGASKRQRHVGISSDYLSRVSFRLIATINHFQNRVYRLWVRFSSEFISEVIENWVGLLSVGLDQGDDSWRQPGCWGQAPLLRLVAVTDPGADWFLCWMHGQESRMCLVEQLRTESGRRLLAVMLNTVLHCWSAGGKFCSGSGGDGGKRRGGSGGSSPGIWGLSDCSVPVVLEACYSHCLHICMCVCRYESSMTLLFPVPAVPDRPAISAVSFIEAALRHVYLQPDVLLERLLLRAVDNSAALRKVCCSREVFSAVAEWLSISSALVNRLCLRRLYFLVRLLLMLSSAHPAVNECWTMSLPLPECCKHDQIWNMSVAVTKSAVSAVRNGHVDVEYLNIHFEVMVNLSGHWRVVDSILRHPTLTRSVEALFVSVPSADLTMVEQRRQYFAPLLASLLRHPLFVNHSLLISSRPVILSWLQENLRRQHYSTNRLFAEVFVYTAPLYNCTVVAEHGREIALYQLVWERWCCSATSAHSRSFSDLCLHWIQAVVLASDGVCSAKNSAIPVRKTAGIAHSLPALRPNNRAPAVSGVHSVRCSIASTGRCSGHSWRHLLTLLVSQYGWMSGRKEAAFLPAASPALAHYYEHGLFITILNIALCSLNGRVYISSTLSSSPDFTPPTLSKTQSISEPGCTASGTCACDRCSKLRVRIAQVCSTCDNIGHSCVCAGASADCASTISASRHSVCQCTARATVSRDKERGGLSARQYRMDSCLLRMERFVSEPPCHTAAAAGGAAGQGAAPWLAACAALFRAVLTAERLVVCSRCGSRGFGFSASSARGRHRVQPQQLFLRRKQRRLKLAADQLQLILIQLLTAQLRAKRTCQPQTKPTRSRDTGSLISVRSRDSYTAPFDDAVADMVLQYARDNRCFSACDGDNNNSRYSSTGVRRRHAEFVTLLRHTRARYNCHDPTHIPWLAAILFLLYNGDWHQCRMLIGFILEQKQSASLCLALWPCARLVGPGTSPVLDTLISWIVQLVECELPSVHALLAVAGVPVGCVCRSWLLQAFLGALSWPETVRYITMLSVFGSDYAVYFSLAVLRYLRPALRSVCRERLPFCSLSDLCLHKFRSVLYFRFMERLSAKYQQGILADVSKCADVT